MIGFHRSTRIFAITRFFFPGGAAANDTSRCYIWPRPRIAFGTRRGARVWERLMPVVAGMELSEQDLAGFREVFDLVDKDGSGAIDAEEVHALLCLLGMESTPEEVDTMVREIDRDGNGEVDFEEFLLVMAGGERKGRCGKKDMLRSFRTFADKSLPHGLISTRALVDALVKYCAEDGGLTFARAKTLVDQLKADENGNIDYLDKVNALMPIG